MSLIFDIILLIWYTAVMNEQLVSQVEDLGLSQKEARVYVANLMLGPATVQRIADYSGIKRVTTYVILESLVNLGLASQTSKGKKTYFSAEDPTNLRRLLDKKEQELKEQQTSFEGILPDLQSLKRLPADSPEVKFYEGVEGIKSVFNTFFATHGGEFKTVYGFSNLDQVYSLFPEFKDALSNPERVSTGLHSKYIYTYSKGAILKDSDKQRNRESRFVPIDKYPVTGDISIAGHHVIIYSLKGPNPMAVTIISAEIAASMMALFQMAWDTAKKFN